MVDQNKTSFQQMVEMVERCGVGLRQAHYIAKNASVDQSITSVERNTAKQYMKLLESAAEKLDMNVHAVDTADGLDAPQEFRMG